MVHEFYDHIIIPQRSLHPDYVKGTCRLHLLRLKTARPQSSILLSSSSSTSTTKNTLGHKKSKKKQKEKTEKIVPSGKRGASIGE
eukprot:Awhi_evm1s8959